MRIFDTFPFDGELDLLEYRLRETFDLVDHFVLVEAGETYRGGAKGLAFAEHEQRFGWARSKIRHVRLAALGSSTAAPRERAAVQRNAARLALADAAPDDVVLLLDVDEVPSRSVPGWLRAEGLDRPRWPRPLPAPPRAGRRPGSARAEKRRRPAPPTSAG